MTVALPDALQRFVVEKGYITLDGVSLTVAAARAGEFDIALIPETLTRTTLGIRKPGDRLNVEVDPIARYALSTIDSSFG
jgi:riboflavin synthase